MAREIPTDATLDLRTRSLGMDPRMQNLPLILKPRHRLVLYTDPNTGTDRKAQGKTAHLINTLRRAGYRISLDDSRDQS